MSLENENISKDELLNDEVLELIKEKLAEEEKYESVINPEAMEGFKFSYAVLKKLAEGTGAKVEYEISSMFRSAGSISITAKNLNILNTKWFGRALEFATNFEIYPKTNGEFRIALAFYGLTKLRKGEGNE